MIYILTGPFGDARWKTDCRGQNGSKELNEEVDAGQQRRYDGAKEGWE